MIEQLKHTIAAGALAVSMLAGYTTPAAAHSFKDCAWDVIEFCGSDQACRDSGIAQCHNHSNRAAGCPIRRIR